MPTIPHRIERVIFLLHGVITIAAAVVLVVFPALIPASVGIAIEPAQDLLLYFLAAAELGIGMLSIGAARLADAAAIRLIAASFAVFHGATAVLEVVYLAGNGTSPMLIANVAVRVVVTAVFLLIAWPHRVQDTRRR